LAIEIGQPKNCNDVPIAILVKSKRVSKGYVRILFKTVIAMDKNEMQDQIYLIIVGHN
jgi:hypothetical protein